MAQQRLRLGFGRPVTVVGVDMAGGEIEVVLCELDEDGRAVVDVDVPARAGIALNIPEELALLRHEQDEMRADQDEMRHDQDEMRADQDVHWLAIEVIGTTRRPSAWSASSRPRHLRDAPLTVLPEP